MPRLATSAPLLAALCLLSISGCATTGERATTAANECKVYLRDTGSLPSGRKAPGNDRLEQQYAVSRLATSDLRWQMQARFGAMGLIEETLRNCEQ